MSIVVLGGYNFAQPTSPPTLEGANGGNMAPGDYQYKITYTTAFGESTAGPATTVFTLIATAVQVTIPFGADKNTSQRTIYRTAMGPSGAFRKVAIVDDNVSTYLDTLNDGGLGDVEPTDNLASSVQECRGITTFSKPISYSASTVTATGTTRADAATLVSEYSFITGAASTGVFLPAIQSNHLGQQITVNNIGGNDLLVYPSLPTETIDGGTAGAAITVIPLTSWTLISTSATAWTRSITMRTEGPVPIISDANNLFLGTAAGNITLTGDFNSGFGDAALQLLSSGSSNVAVGYRALAANLIVSNLTAVGTMALANNTTGINNVAVGYYNLLNNSGGSSNTSVGYRAMDSNANGSWNTALGYMALESNTNGHYNTSIGCEALTGSNGDRGIGIGYHSLYNNNNGNDNIGIGYESLAANINGDDNVAIGNNALAANVNSGGNVCVGHNSLMNSNSTSGLVAVGNTTLMANTSGARSTAIGYDALIANTTGDDNIALGYQSGTGVTTADNTINIGAAGVNTSARIQLGTGGTHTTCFIAGVRGSTTANANAIPVLIDSAHQLGTASSLRSKKENISDVDLDTNHNVIMQLKPRRFSYITNASAAADNYGLIVDEVGHSDLIASDSDGNPETIYYNYIPIINLAEIQRLNAVIADLTNRLTALEV